MKKYDITQLRSLPIEELSGDEVIAALWKEAGIEVLKVIERQNTVPMTMPEFLNHCVACGGNWGGMLLSGVQALYPEVYAVIPDNMGHFAFRCICEVLELLQIKGEE